MESAFDAGAVIKVERGNVLSNSVNVLISDLAVSEEGIAGGIPSKGRSSDVNDDLEELVKRTEGPEGGGEIAGQEIDESKDLIGIVGAGL